MKRKIGIGFGVVSTLTVLFFAYNYRYYSIPTSGMSLTVNPGDYVLVDKTKDSYNDLQRNDVSVFHFPMADTVLLEQPNRIYEQMIRDVALELDISEDEARIYIHQNYIIETNGIAKKTHFIQRAVAVAGDKLEIKNAQLYINDMISEDIEAIQYSYKVVTDGTEFNEKVLRKRKITFEPLYYSPMNDYGNVTMTLSKTGLEKLKQISIVKSVEKIIKPKGYDFAFQAYPIFPNDEKFDWSTDNYGPLTIPKKGVSVKLTLDNLPLYKRIIRIYEKNELKVEGNKILINNQAVHTYTFKMNYYFMLGDNRHNSQDSRYWGFVPEDHLIGEMVKVLYANSE